MTLAVDVLHELRQALSFTVGMTLGIVLVPTDVAPRLTTTPSTSITTATRTEAPAQTWVSC